MSTYQTGIVTDSGEAAYDIPIDVSFNTKIRAIQNNDPVSADTIVNPLIQAIIDNIYAVKNMAETSEAVISSTEPPPDTCTLWYRHLGTAAGLDWDTVLSGWSGNIDTSGLPVYLTAYVGEAPPTDTTLLWFQPEST